MSLPFYRFSLSVFVLLLPLALFFSTARAAEKKPGNKVPTSITASSMEYNADAQTVVFKGNVHVTRPDFELWAATITIYLDKKNSRQSSSAVETGTEGMQAGDINRIVAEKKVRMKSEAKEGTCEKATYFAKDDKFVMEGSPVLKDKGKNTITGHTVVHYLGTNRSEVLGGVEATFFTPDNTEKQTPGAGSARQRTAP